MKTLNDLKKDVLAARKNRDTFRATVLTTLLSDVNTRAKKELREATDDDLYAAAKYFMKNLEKSRDLRVTQAIMDEIEIIGEIVPMQACQPVAVDVLIPELLEKHPEQVEKRNTNFFLGQVMKAIQGRGNPQRIKEEIEEHFKSA